MFVKGIGLAKIDVQRGNVAMGEQKKLVQANSLAGMECRRVE